MEPQVFLIEDNPDDEQLAVRALARGGSAKLMAVARDGQDAIDQIKQFTPSYCPSVILLDLKLPKLNGLQVLSFLRSHPLTSLTPVVVFTSSDEEKDIKESYARGANSYVRKPVDYREFVAQIGMIVDYWTVLNRRARPLADTDR